MKKLIFAGLLIVSTGVHAEEIGKIIAKSKTVGAFIENSAWAVDPAVLPLLKDKIKGHEFDALDFVQMGPRLFTFNPKHAPLKMSINDVPGGVTIVVNGHTVSSREAETPEKFLQRLEKAFPKETASFSLFPEAHAGAGFKLVVAGVGAAMSYVTVGVISVQAKCPDIGKNAAFCASGKFGYTKDSLQKLAQQSMDADNYYTYCTENKALHDCLVKQAEKINVSVDDKYREYFKQNKTDAGDKPAKTAN